MLHNEFRESVDIDFLISDKQHYRSLRTLIRDKNSLTAIMYPEFASIFSFTDIRQDQYGIRTKVKVADTLIKFEIVLEGRISFCVPDEKSNIAGVSTLSNIDLAASKLLANSDRGFDASVCYRDIIDLAMMNLTSTNINTALHKAKEAYGKTVIEDINGVVDFLQNKPAALKNSLLAMQMTVPMALVWQKIKALQKCINKRSKGQVR